MTWCPQGSWVPSAEQASMHPDHRVCCHYQTAVCETEQHRRKKKLLWRIEAARTSRKPLELSWESSEQQGGHRATCPRDLSPQGIPAKPWGRDSHLWGQSPSSPLGSQMSSGCLWELSSHRGEKCLQSCKEALPNNHHPLESCVCTRTGIYTPLSKTLTCQLDISYSPYLTESNFLALLWKSTSLSIGCTAKVNFLKLNSERKRERDRERGRKEKEEGKK